jgi:hypothetical protein
MHEAHTVERRGVMLLRDLIARMRPRQAFCTHRLVEKPESP